MKILMTTFLLVAVCTFSSSCKEVVETNSYKTSMQNVLKKVETNKEAFKTYTLRKQTYSEAKLKRVAALFEMDANETPTEEKDIVRIGLVRRFGRQSIFSPPVQTNFPLEKGARGFLSSSYHSRPSPSSSILTLVPMTPPSHS